MMLPDTPNAASFRASVLNEACHTSPAMSNSPATYTAATLAPPEASTASHRMPTGVCEPSPAPLLHRVSLPEAVMRPSTAPAARFWPETMVKLLVMTSLSPTIRCSGVYAPTDRLEEARIDMGKSP